MVATTVLDGLAREREYEHSGRRRRGEQQRVGSGDGESETERRDDVVERERRRMRGVGESRRDAEKRWARDAGTLCVRDADVERASFGGGDAADAAVDGGESRRGAIRCSVGGTFETKLWNAFGGRENARRDAVEA